MTEDPEELFLDYSEFFEQTQIDSSDEEAKTKTGWNLFHDKGGWCPFCNAQANTEHSHTTCDGWNTDVAAAWSCKRCGWWEIYQRTYNSISETEYYEGVRHRTAVLRMFDIKAKYAPIGSLADYIRKKPSSIHRINPVAMEKLVQAVFSEHMDCEVVHVGKSHDNGIDLLFVDGNSPCAVQVKRRENPNKTESVELIRSFLGAVQLARGKQAWLVTLADKFSSQAENSAKSAVELGLLDKYELVPRGRFLEMVKGTKEQAEMNWRKSASDWFLPDK